MARSAGAPEPAQKRGVVSVLIPLYNHERTVEATLDSLLLSDCSTIELIVSDDASTDRSYECACTWIDEQSRRFESACVFRQSRNLGITGNLNYLVGHARGEYVTLVASDDKLTAQAIGAQREYLAANPDTDFVFGNVGKIDSAGNILDDTFVNERRAAALRSRTCATFDMVFNWDLTWSRLFARLSAFLRFGGYIAEHSFEDRWCALKILQTGRFGYLHRVVHLYRFRGESTGRAGIDLQRILGDLQDVERRLVSETTGLLKVLLLIRSRSLRRAGRGPRDRLFWLLMRRAIGAGHLLLIGRSR